MLFQNVETDVATVRSDITQYSPVSSSISVSSVCPLYLDPWLPGCLPQCLQHGMFGGPALQPHPSAGDGAGPQTAGKFQPSLLAGHPLPGGGAARLPGGRLPLGQVWEEAGDHGGRHPSLLHLVHHSRGSLHTDHLCCQVSQSALLSLLHQYQFQVHLGSGHRVDPPQHWRVRV